ncbi:MAG: 2TM domain-containing protein [Saprospiraceae bacterium]
MNKELRKKAKKKVEAKMAFYICAIVFTFVTVLLLMLSFYLPGAGFWLRLPIPVFVMVLIILYLSAFGLPATGALSKDWQEEEIEKEMFKLYQQKKAQIPPPEDLSETDILELKELERLKKKWDWGEDYV